MYERNAIVLERYFNQMFGYNMRNNIKTNFRDYCDIVECLEKYKNISEEEENIIQEYDEIANTIREIQKTQENTSKKTLKLIDETNNIFQNIDENVDSMQKKIANLNKNIQELNNTTQENEQLFVSTISEFNEKSKVRTACSRARRNIENEYNKRINNMLDNYQEIDIECEKRAKQFVETNTEKLEKELKDEMKKNGEKEKIPFNTEVIVKAITLCVDIQKRETDIYAGIYDKTNKLFTEIKNNTVKIDKHKKVIKDSKCKINFLSALKEYLVQFLDNERLTSVNGEEEHNKLMIEACKNLDEDLLQINNLYTLLLKEISKKITKKSYSELYNYNYLEKLEQKTAEFDEQIRKLNLSVTIINPNHWRIEGMKKIYDTFNKCVIEEYDRDLTDYLPKQESKNEKIEIEEDDEIQEEEEQKNDEEIVKDSRSEIDRKIDMILGLSEEDSDDDEDDDENDFEDDWEDEKEENAENGWNEEKEEDDDWYYDETENDEDYDDSLEDDENSKQEDEEFEDKKDTDNNYDEDEDFDDDWDVDIFGEKKQTEKENDNQNTKTNSRRRERTEEDWENAFIRIEQKNKAKRKGFFDKFRK